MNFGAIIKFYENHKKIIKWFILIFFALFTAFLYLLYYLCLFHNLKNMGEPIYPLRTEGSLGIQSELTMFAIRVREIIDGYWHVADPGFYEYRYFPVRLNEMLPPAVYYFIYLFTGLKYLFAIGDSLLIFASFILIFFLIYLLTQRYYIGLFFTFMFLMVKDFLFLVFPGLRPISNINQFKELIKAFSPFVFQDWEMPRRADFVVSLSTRPGILFFAPTLIFLFLFVKDKKNIYAAMLGICYGLLFYTYPFYWMYMTIVFGLLGAVYLWRKNFSQFKKLIFSGAIAWAISVLYWLNQIKLRILPQFQDIKNHAFVIVYGGNFQWSYYFWYLFCATLALLIYFYAKKKDKMHIAYYLIPLLAAGFVGFNMQVITGFNFSSSNWWTRVGFVPIFLAIAVLFSWFFEYLEEKHKI